MKSIRTQIIAVILCIVFVLSLTFGVLSCVLNFSTATSVLEQNMTELARIAANQVSGEITIMKNRAVQVGMDSRLSDTSRSNEELKGIAEQYVKDFGFAGCDLLKINGDSRFNGDNYWSADFFKASVKGATFMSDPTPNAETGALSYLISAPIWKGGQINSGIVGVVCFYPDPDFLNQIMDELKPSQNGYGYMINQEDVSVADIDRSLVGRESVFELLETDPSLSELAEIEKKMIAGESGFGYHQYEGQKWVEAYAPIQNSNGWSLAIMSPQSDFLGNFYLSILVTVAVTLAFLVLGVLTATLYARRLTRPLKVCADRLNLLSHSDLHSPVDASHRRDEIGTLQNSTRELVSTLQAVVSDISELLGQLAMRNLDAKSSMEYEGDFRPIKSATDQIAGALSEAMSEIREASHAVDAGAGQVAASAQALSQGATEQASSLQELSATVAELSAQVRLNAHNAQSAREQAAQSSEHVGMSSAKMEQMSAAMGNISARSGEIGKIIKTIENISFQTNILALNAAVEAARAGVAGKGFAVVAGEVRNLAAKSAQAAQSTTALISETVQAVEDGTRIMGETTQAMAGVVTGARNVTVLIEQIAKASGDQASAIEQVTLGLDQISGVVQTNSATAEESAAASEELSGQAQLLKDLVGHFQLRGQGAGKRSAMGLRLPGRI